MAHTPGCRAVRERLNGRLQFVFVPVSVVTHRLPIFCAKLSNICDILVLRIVKKPLFLWREDDKKGYACVLIADIALLDD